MTSHTQAKTNRSVLRSTIPTCFINNGHSLAMKRSSNPPTAAGNESTSPSPSSSEASRASSPSAADKPANDVADPVAVETASTNAATRSVAVCDDTAASRAPAIDAAADVSNDAPASADLLRNSAAGLNAWQPDDPRVHCYNSEDDPPFHPATAHFPIVETHVGKLAESIGIDGLAEPVLVLVDGDGAENIIDGRHRFLACKQAGVPCTYRATHTLPEGESAEAFVRRKFRQSAIARQLTRTELAFLAARMIPTLAKEAKVRQEAGVQADADDKGTSCAIAAREIGCDLKANAVRNADDILQKHPALEELVMTKAVVLSTAAAIANLKDRRQRDRATKAVRAGCDKATLRAIIKGKPDETTLALQLHWDERANELLAEWDRHERNLDAFRVWLAKMSDENTQKTSTIGRVVLGLVKPSVIDELVTAMQESKPAVPCEWCKPPAFCTACAGSGWLTTSEHARHVGAATEAYRDMLAEPNS